MNDKEATEQRTKVKLYDEYTDLIKRTRELNQEDEFVIRFRSNDTICIEGSKQTNANVSVSFCLLDEQAKSFLRSLVKSLLEQQIAFLTKQIEQL